MNDIEAVFERSCHRLFRFLVDDYGCRRLKTDRKPYWSSITFKNRTTAAEVRLEYGDNGVFVYLIRLVGGRIPAEPDLRSSKYLLDMLVSLRSSRRSEIHAGRSTVATVGDSELPDAELVLSLLTVGDIEISLARYAEALRVYGDDVLRGDFRIFDKLAERRRAAYLHTLVASEGGS